MSLVTVVVPIYNVAPYLEACLDSIATQSHAELDVVLVDDGSTDGSHEIAQRYVERDARFRLHRQPNGGLGNARNNGIDLARVDLLSFVDSDDVLAPDAYERLVGSLVATGSDIATGRFRRLTAAGSRPAFFVGKAFARDRQRVRISEFHELAVDRTAWGKVFRRSFWDTHGFRFGEGVSYEDQYATLPAYFLADGVDVLSATVYFWRIREGADTSITQRREQPREVIDRVAAVTATSEFLARRFPREKAWYERTVMLLDLGYAAEVLVSADPDEQQELLQRLQSWHAQVDPEASADLPVMAGLTWELVRRGAIDDLATLLRGAPAPGRPVPVRRRRGSWVAELPLRDRFPESRFRVDDELAAVATVTDVEQSGDEIRVRGIVDFPELRPVSRFRRRLLAWMEDPAGRRIDLSVRATSAGDFTITVPHVVVAGSGSRDLTWNLHVELRQRGLRCEAKVSAGEPGQPACVARIGDRRMLRTEVGPGGLRVHAQTPTEWISAAVVEDGLVWLQVASAHPSGHGAELLLAGSSERRLRLPVESTDAGWSAALPIDRLSAGLDDPTAPQTCRRADAVQWTMTLLDQGRRRQVWNAAVEQPVWSDATREVWLSVNGAGLSVLVDRRRRPLLTDVTPGAREVELALTIPEGVRPTGYVAVGAGGVEQQLVAATDDPAAARIVVPADLVVHGPWRICWRDPDGPTRATHLGVTPGLLQRPIDLPMDGTDVRLGRDRNGAVVVAPRR